MSWLFLEGYGVIAIERIVAVGPAEAAPIRRLLDVTPASHIIVLTAGHRRQSVVVLDSGHIVLTALPVTRLQQLLRTTTWPEAKRDGQEVIILSHHSVIEKEVKP